LANFNLGTDGTYTSFSGADAIATFNGQVIGELQAITINIQREKGPIYVLGDPDPLSFSRGKRGIAGNLVFVMFDRDALLVEMEQAAAQFGTIPQYTAAGNQGVIQVNAQPTNLVNQAGVYNGLPLNSTLNNLSTVVQFNAANAAQVAANSTPFVQLHGDQPGEFWTYEDQVPPFDITITFANEYGNAANMIIQDVEILNEGTGVSIDDINLERACTFIARKAQRLRPGFYTSGIANTSSPISQSSVTPNGQTGKTS
jgi:sporulation protein YlmC with PRC-barrel domain